MFFLLQLIAASDESASNVNQPPPIRIKAGYCPSTHVNAGEFILEGRYRSIQENTRCFDTSKILLIYERVYVHPLWADLKEIFYSDMLINNKFFFEDPKKELLFELSKMLREDTANSFSKASLLERLKQKNVKKLEVDFEKEFGLAQDNYSRKDVIDLLERNNDLVFKIASNIGDYLEHQQSLYIEIFRCIDSSSTSEIKLSIGLFSPKKPGQEQEVFFLQPIRVRRFDFNIFEIDKLEFSDCKRVFEAQYRHYELDLKEDLKEKIFGDVEEPEKVEIKYKDEEIREEFDEEIEEDAEDPKPVDDRL